MADISKTAKSALPYVQRLAQDQYVHDHAANAALQLRKAYGRIASQGGKAAEDQKLYDRLREAATSIRKAGVALQGGKPEPKRRGRTILVVLAGGGAAAILLTGGRREKLQSAVRGAKGADPVVADAPVAPAT
jgi:predicted RNA-binding Zn ribbon-like protein